VPRAVAIAAEFAALPGEPLRHTRRQVRAPALDLIAGQRADDELVRQMWDSPAARDAVGRYVTKTLRK
jgi:hypothetical protein